MAYATFYPEVKISENDIIEYISEGDPEYIKKFIMKIISDKYDRTIDENCALLLLMEMTMKLARQLKYECPEKSKKYKEINLLVNELYEN